MNKLQKQAASALAAGALLLQFAAPALGASYSITGNGRDSTSLVDVNYDREVDIEQDNDADIENNVSVSTDTGGNRVSDTTAGDVFVDTGDTEVGVAIDNMANLNQASVDTCGDCGLDGELKISGNARNTGNTIDLYQESDVDVDQDNDADFENDVDVTANSGRNRVADSTNGGEITVDTGDVTINPIRIVNSANANIAVVAGSDDEGEGLSLMITGNARNSESLIDVNTDNDVDVDQDNDADFENDVDVAAFSGNNRILDAMSGLVEVDTGDVEVGVLVDNMANFNWADVEECCFLGDLSADIFGNARNTDNTIDLEFDDELDVDQDNDFDCDGSGDSCADVDVTGKSGGNHVADTLGEIDGDPSIDTGDAGVGVSVANSANMNAYGLDLDFDFDEVLELLEDLFDGDEE